MIRTNGQQVLHLVPGFECDPARGAICIGEWLFQQGNRKDWQKATKQALHANCGSSVKFTNDRESACDTTPEIKPFSQYLRTRSVTRNP